MTQIAQKYSPGKGGLATEFSLSETPIEYMRGFTNRFINIRGDAEKRQGITRLGNVVSGLPTITGIHEYVDRIGNSYLFVSAAGTIWRLDNNTTWTQVLTGKDINSRMLSVQMANKLIFVNGVDRNFYTDNAGETFNELKAIVESGQASSGTSATSLTDSAITSWIASTFVTNNDIIYNATRGAYAIVTSVGASNLSCSPISNAATGIGFSSSTQASGDRYEVIDAVALNIIPSLVGDDNFATLTSGTSSTVVAVSGVNFANTEVEVGDFIYNTTRNAITAVTSVGSTLDVTSITGQVANDSVTFFKSAMPIATYPHVHYGRLYLIDARNRSDVRVSGPNDPTDFTTSQNTLNSITAFYGSKQPQAEILLALKTFQQYLVAGGQRNVYASTGIDPIADTTAQATDFSPIGLFPQGCVSRYGIESIGNSMTFSANDGLRSFLTPYNANAVQTNNLSEVIKSEVAQAISTKAVNDPDEIQTIHYPRRNWLLFKIGDTIYNYNYTPSYAQGQIVNSVYGSFSKFTGKFANQKIYYIRRNGDLLCAGGDGLVYEFDKGDYSDDNENIFTVLRTAYLNLDEGTKEDIRWKSGTYIQPVFESTSPIDYTIDVVGGFDSLTNDSTSITTTGVGEVGFASVGVSPIGGQRITTSKLPLRWKGQKFYIEITTNTTEGPDVITGWTIYGNILGKK
jgi:hypothetical protein